METISVGRIFDAPADRIRSTLGDPTAFFDAAGFEVERDGDLLKLRKRATVMQVELTIRLRDDETATLAYEQTSGPFEAMATRYRVDQVSAGSRLTIETSFEPPTTSLGATLGTAMIERQRRTELDTVGSLLEVTAEPVDGATKNRAVETRGD